MVDGDGDDDDVRPSKSVSDCDLYAAVGEVLGVVPFSELATVWSGRSLAMTMEGLVAVVEVVVSSEDGGWYSSLTVPNSKIASPSASSRSPSSPTSGTTRLSPKPTVMPPWLSS